MSKPTKASRKDAPGIALQESAALDSIEIDPELAHRLAAVPSEEVDEVMRIGFLIKEGLREFACRLDVDEAKRRRDELQSRAEERPSDDPRRSEANAADRQWRFEYAWKLWREALEMMGDGHSAKAIVHANKALHWSAVPEFSDALSSRLLRKENASKPRAPRLNQEELHERLNLSEGEWGDESALARKLAREECGPRCTKQDVERMRGRIRRSKTAAQKKLDG